MAVTTPLPGTQARVVREPGSRWPWQCYLALLIVPYLAWEGWTLASWAAAGPYQVTEFRSTGDLYWWAARVFEAAAIVMAVVLGWVLVRNARRERRITFDIMLAIAGLLAYWQDPLANFYHPVLTYSSNFVNVTNWCSQTPLVVNPDCGRVTEPVLFLSIFYSFGFVLAAMLGGWFMRVLKRRNPEISTGRMLVYVGLYGMAFDMVLEISAVILHLWNYPAAPNSFSLFGPRIRYPLFVAVGAIWVFGSLTVIRNFKNDKGETFFERGLERLSPRRRLAVTFLSLVAFLQVFVTVANVVFMAPMGFWANTAEDLPAHVVNGICDMSGFEGTQYGACPGTRGQGTPVRTKEGQAPPRGPHPMDWYQPGD